MPEEESLEDLKARLRNSTTRAAQCSEVEDRAGTGGSLTVLQRVTLWWRLKWHVCPLCNSDAPESDNCPVCEGVTGPERPARLTLEQRAEYRRRYVNHHRPRFTCIGCGSSLVSRWWLWQYDICHACHETATVAGAQARHDAKVLQEQARAREEQERFKEAVKEASLELQREGALHL